jgi:hypothetical protein
MGKTQRFFTIALIVVLVAALGTVLRYGFPPREPSVKVLGAIIFFGGIAAAVILMQDSRGSRR